VIVLLQHSLQRCG